MASRARVFVSLWLISCASGFVVSPTTRWSSKQAASLPPLSMTSAENDGSMDEMRRLLEGSWNSDQMGKLPATPIDAANEAGGSLLTAKQRGLDLVLVNLLLPSYDITMGSNLYDEVEAVQFCVALSEFLEGKACIVVRDNKTVHAVSRVLEARAKEEEEKAAAAKANLAFVEQKEDELGEEDKEEYEEDDDDEDEEVVEESSGDGEKSAELEDFRRQLMMDWGDDDAATPADDAESTANEDAGTVPVEETIAKQNPTPGEDSEPEAAFDDMLNPAPKPKSFRLTSMFGDATFKAGPDMFEKVIQAVSANGQPKEGEDTLVILSANSEEETIGIRALVAKYQQSKTIVLVNCQMNPIPRELLKAETIYSLLPLIAKPKDSEAAAPSVSQPKVIVLRRYPRDFEVYMDFGNGFDLTETVTTGQVGRTGPSMEWIADRVRRQMDARS